MPERDDALLFEDPTAWKEKFRQELRQEYGQHEQQSKVQDEFKRRLNQAYPDLKGEDTLITMAASKNQAALGKITDIDAMVSAIGDFAREERSRIVRNAEKYPSAERDTRNKAGLAFQPERDAADARIMQGGPTHGSVYAESTQGDSEEEAAKNWSLSKSIKQRRQARHDHIMAQKGLTSTEPYDGRKK